jgi:hypothetical protein
MSFSNSTKRSCMKKDYSELFTQKNFRKFYLYMSKIYATDFYLFEPITIQYLKRFKLNTDTKMTKFTRLKSPAAKKCIPIFCYDFSGFED